jgi:hypothetical protein
MVLFAPNGVDLKDNSGPFVALTEAIFETLGTSGGEGSDTTLSPGQLRLVIFPRPLTFPRAPASHKAPRPATYIPLHPCRLDQVAARTPSTRMPR